MPFTTSGARWSQSPRQGILPGAAPCRRRQHPRTFEAPTHRPIFLLQISFLVVILDALPHSLIVVFSFLSVLDSSHSTSSARGLQSRRSSHPPAHSFGVRTSWRPGQMVSSPEPEGSLPKTLLSHMMVGAASVPANVPNMCCFSRDVTATY